jgi:hypothetical protein
VDLSQLSRGPQARDRQSPKSDERRAHQINPGNRSRDSGSNGEDGASTTERASAGRLRMRTFPQRNGRRGAGQGRAGKARGPSEAQKSRAMDNT